MNLIVKLLFNSLLRIFPFFSSPFSLTNSSICTPVRLCGRVGVWLYTLRGAARVALEERCLKEKFFCLLGLLNDINCILYPNNRKAAS